MNTVTINEEKIKQAIIQKVANYWNGREVTITGGIGAHWSDFDYYEREREVIDPVTGEVTIETYMQRDRIPNTHDYITAISGIIHTQVNGDKIDFFIEYNITITNRE